MKNENLILRAKIIESIRKFFWSQDFIETDTPTLVYSPGMEPYICPIEVREQGSNNSTHRAYLHTSPEFAMKKILAKDFNKIFQVCKCYRAEPKSITHEPEFTMLEWYRSNSTYEQIMNDCEDLFNFILKSLNRKTFPKWNRYTIEECFKKISNIQLETLLPANAATKSEFFNICKKRQYTNNDQLTWDDYFFLIMLNEIEPALAKEATPVIVYNYPETQAALSNIFTDERGLKWAKRFEIYADGIELANAFDELIDPIEQRKRFEIDQLTRKSNTGYTNPIDEAFIQSLSKLKPSAGIALGVDRLIMYILSEKDIKNIIWQESYWH